MTKRTHFHHVDTILLTSNKKLIRKADSTFANALPECITLAVSLAQRKCQIG